MMEECLLQLLSVQPLFEQKNGRQLAIWSYLLSWPDAGPSPFEGADGDLWIALSIPASVTLDNLPVNDANVKETHIERASGLPQLLKRAAINQQENEIIFAFVADAQPDPNMAVGLCCGPVAGEDRKNLRFQTRLGNPGEFSQTIVGPSSIASTQTVERKTSARTIEKATLVPLQSRPKAPEANVRVQKAGDGLLKALFMQHLALAPGEVQIVSDRLKGKSTDNAEKQKSPISQRTVKLLTAFERTALPAVRPRPDAISIAPKEELVAFANALQATRKNALMGELRKHNQDAGLVGKLVTALNSAIVGGLILQKQGTAAPIGMLNLERLEMTPAGIERGGLVASIPLAPLEETSVTQSEWSVTTKEFTSIVTDYLENVSETGVTDNTELSQSVTSQVQHGNQFNITGTVTGGIPIINGSSTTSFTDQGSESKSATDSRKFASSITRKASSRSTSEHKVTISTVAVTGQANVTTRKLKNNSLTDPMRIDYFSLMRRWNVRLYRYGLRLTYDIVIPEPASAMRAMYAELDELQSRLVPFVFPYSETILDNKYQNPLDPPLFKQLAAKFHVLVPDYPSSGPVLRPSAKFDLPNVNWMFGEVAFDVPDGYEISEILLDAKVGDIPGPQLNFSVMGSAYYWQGAGPLGVANILLVNVDGTKFLEGTVGRVLVPLFFHNGDKGWVGLTVRTRPSASLIAKWKSDVWNILVNAAQLDFYREQQEIQTRIVDLEAKLTGVDTLTLRREESDEIMKAVLRFLLGVNFSFMPQAVVDALAKTGGGVKTGSLFDSNELGISASEISTISQYEDIVRFINQAIEWENVTTFLYSYFWDIPSSWDFIRQLRHPDSTRQAFLRAGSARVVLTIRKGWEESWVRFQETLDPNGFTTTPYLTIAKEIAAYDDRNYPGIPPANPMATAARLEEDVYVTSTTAVNPPDGGLSNVAVQVDTTDMLSVGAKVVVDSVVSDDPTLRDGRQEQATITEVLDSATIKLDMLKYKHGMNGSRYVIRLPGEKGALIAEWAEYTPTSAIDIAVTSNLATIA
ncbi:hypothetical protein [Rhizobium sp. S96]|uniref:hypothetical protein n=1 Tax=Rhizobium sp. S96 TaxID=3055140 RepID=UPI0025AB3456|nr:hypothetical protein [Rhizobium sp. S96]MDM9623158.1 hypothetical protein [Rhizobium sp. S96]